MATSYRLILLFFCSLNASKSCTWCVSHIEIVAQPITTNYCEKRLGGRAWSGRLATPSNAGGTRHPLTLTAISVSVTQRRSVVLWSLCDALPADSAQLIAHPVDGVLVVGANEIIYVDGGGRMRCGVASNGFARATCPASLVSPKVDKSAAAPTPSSASSEAIVTANPSPLPLLSFALDGWYDV